MTPVTPESYADTASSNKGKRLGEEVEAQLAAQRVFDSKPPKMPSSGRGSQFVSFVLLPLLLRFRWWAGFWYWFETTQSSSVVGRGGQPSGFVDTVIDFFVPQQSIVATPPPPRTPCDAAACRAVGFGWQFGIGGRRWRSAGIHR